jgi:hypothetical protein
VSFLPEFDEMPENWKNCENILQKGWTFTGFFGKILRLNL